MKNIREGIPVYKHYINNQWRDAESSRLFDVHEPCSGRVFARVPAGGRKRRSVRRRCRS